MAMRLVRSTDNVGAAYEAYARRLLAYVRSRWSKFTGAEPEDICQEVWLRYREKGPPLADGNLVPAWLFRVAHNLCEDLRKKSRPLALGEGVDPAGGTATADAEAVRKEEADRLAECLRRLEKQEPQIGALARALLGGELYAEVRDRLGLAANRASEMKATAVQMLRQCVGAA